MASSIARVRVFLLITAVCVAAVIYTLWSAQKIPPSSDAGVATSSIPVAIAPPPPAESSSTGAERSPRAEAPNPASPATDHSGNASRVGGKPSRQSARLLAINVRDSPDLGTVEIAAVDAVDTRTTTNLRCERVHFAHNEGICLSRQLRFFSAQTVATIVDEKLTPLFTVRADGIPSRARVSPDGRYAAFTVFVTGHSYADAQLSTATLLVDIEQRTTLANLEEFDVVQDGAVIKAADFNFWGVTFKHDSRLFFATLRTGGINYLVQGDIAARRMTVLHQGVECPSLSPDETRIAFKKMVARAEWRLTVLDLSTFAETSLTETRNVDDQAEWLDNDRLLYSLPDPAPWMSIIAVPADGRGAPVVFAKGASSPAVIRQLRQ